MRVHEPARGITIPEGERAVARRLLHLTQTDTLPA